MNHYAAVNINAAEHSKSHVLDLLCVNELEEQISKIKTGYHSEQYYYHSIEVTPLFKLPYLKDLYIYNVVGS